MSQITHQHQFLNTSVLTNKAFALLMLHFLSTRLGWRWLFRSFRSSVRPQVISCKHSAQFAIFVILFFRLCFTVSQSDPIKRILDLKDKFTKVTTLTLGECVLIKKRACANTCLPANPLFYVGHSWHQCPIN